MLMSLKLKMYLQFSMLWKPITELQMLLAVLRLLLRGYAKTRSRLLERLLALIEHSAPEVPEPHERFKMSYVTC